MAVWFDISKLPFTTLTCDRLILSVGTFGTLFLLMKNWAVVFYISKKLGSRYCVNGDLLSFIMRCQQENFGVKTPRITDPSYGPVITSAIRMGDTEDGEEGRGFYVEDGGNPEFLTYFLDAADLSGFGERLARFGKHALSSYLGFGPIRDMNDELTDLMGQSVASKSSFPILSMGRDIPNGNMKLRDGLLDVDWTIEESQAYYKRLTDTVRSIAGALNAHYEDNLAYSVLKQVLTAHPLGGCPMGRNADEGVVDSYGAVFGYPGLYIADGSVMPGPTGANPSLTIGALSDRFAERIIETRKGV